ncbi:MAG: PEP-utilizing enzyme [Jatrophihabitans sp.]|uniref:PEP-utilizing enzyme n=1 Tax=Jatrophihabitans sp. TaxID=1932789 RepID=UPI003F81AB41
MAVIPVDEFVTDEWYPGFTPSYGQAPFVVEPFGTFSKADEQRFWFLDFHWPRGLTPLGTIAMEDGYAWGTQLAAEQLPLPPGRGVAQRMAGTHAYAAAIPVDRAHERAARAARLQRSLPAVLSSLRTTWADRVDELDAGWQHFRQRDLSRCSLPELAALLDDARRYHRRAWEIHFEVMYPLLFNHLAFARLCSRLGVDPDRIGTFLAGCETRIMESDRALGGLTAAARSAGLAPVFHAHEPEDLASALAGHPWLALLDRFLDEHGDRTEGIDDVALPSWREDPTPVLGTVKTLLQKGVDHDFDAALTRVRAERDAALDEVRSTLTGQEQQVFDAGLAAAEQANFPQWQDDHNVVIDLRVSLPMRHVALEIAARVGATRPDDTVFLFFPELAAVAAGERSYTHFAALVEERRQYYDHWRARRSRMPKVLGTCPDAVRDPILIEVFGLNRQFLRTVEAAAAGTAVTTFTGIAAARGVARGAARVLADSDALHRLRPGEVLVCESTSPNWTPAFAKAAACVCDTGGMLSHAAIVGREYGVPTVTACGIATAVIKDGDELEVDGDRGVVTLVRAHA